ncbi:MAG: apolipoprotein N-acyltransferase [Spiribacter sp.]|nr:apolipoprotein N-acyltransferase [Spiribacter sp.]
MMMTLRVALALAAGLLLPLGFAPYGQAWAPVLGLAVIFALIAPAQRPWQVLLPGYLFGLGFAGLGVYWIYHSIANYGGGPLAGAIATGVLVALFALIPMLALLLGWRAMRRHSTCMVLMGLPAAWVLVEWVRSWLFTGATWLSIGYTQIDTPLAALAPVFGVYGPGLAVALVAGALAWWFLRPLSLRLLVPVLMLGVFTLAGLVLDRTWSVPSGEPLSVSIIQGNVAQSRKWDPDESADILSEYLSESRAAFGQSLIVWPETAVPAVYQQVEDWLETLAADAQGAGSTLILGTPAADPAGEGLFNAVAVPGEDTQFYYKRHLVPFGEYVPFRAIAGGILDFVGTPLGDFSAGRSAEPLRAAGHAVGVSICYEVTFGTEVLDALPGAEILLNVSNDAWFGQTAAPWQHLQMARMRAVETARPMIRATNTGVSVLIDAQGEVSDQGPLFEAAVIEGEVVPRQGMTPYMRWRDWPMAGGSAALLLIGTLLRRRGVRLFRDV